MFLVFSMLVGCYPWVTPEEHAANNPDCSDPQVWFIDVDGDGIGTDAETQTQCRRPDGFTGTDVDGDGSS